MKYVLLISKTADGEQDYLQIISEDNISVNIVLIGEFDVTDTRGKATYVPL